MLPALTGTLLPGVVRDSLLQLAPELGLTVEQGRISVDEWRKGAEDGSITEVFACGTAAVIAPVGHAKSSSGEWTMGDGDSGEVTLRLRQALLDLIRPGRRAHGDQPLGDASPRADRLTSDAASIDGDEIYSLPYGFGVRVRPPAADVGSRRVWVHA